MNWITVISTIGNIGIVCIFIFYIWQLEKVRTYEAVIKQNNQLIDIVRASNDILTTRIFRDAWLVPIMMKDEESKDIFANHFHRMNLTEKQMQDYGMPQQIIDKRMNIFHEEKKKKTN